MDIFLIILIAVGSLIFIGLTISGIATMLYKNILKTRLNESSTIPKTASELAKQELTNHSIKAQVVRVPTNNNAHYDYKNKIVALSDNFFSSYSAVAQAISMHEVGHAIQDKNNSKKFNTFKKFNTASSILAPLFWISLIVGVALYFAIDYTIMPAIISLAFAGLCIILETSFKLLTASMEKEASNKALEILQENGISHDDYNTAKSLYKIALTTYYASIFKPVIDLFNAITWLIYNTIGRIFR